MFYLLLFGGPRLAHGDHHLRTLTGGYAAGARQGEARHTRLADLPGRPWRIAFVMGVILAVGLMIIPLTVRTFIYFEF